MPAEARNLESIRGEGGGSGTTQAFPAFLQVKELLGRSSDTLTQTRHGRCSWSGNWTVLDTRNTHRVKVKFTIEQATKAQKESYSSTLSLNSALDGGGWSTPRPGRFTPGKDLVPIVQGAGWGPRAGLNRCGKSRLPPGCDPRTVQLVANRYTD